VVTALAALQIRQAVFVGSSRGGILTMLLAAAQRAAIAGAVLHDIGPVIELSGLARIKAYVGKLPRPGSLAEGADILRSSRRGVLLSLNLDQTIRAGSPCGYAP